MNTNGNYWQKITNKIEIFFLIYILLQPFLDLVSYFGTSVSTIVRALIMVVGFVYLLLYPNKKIRWGTTIYVVFLGIFMVIHTINNYMIKDPYNLMQEFTYAVKSAYVVEMLIVYAAVFLSLSKKMDWQKIVQRNMFINFVIISLVMLMAVLTGTGKQSYERYEKWDFFPTEGHSGWFYSANDLGALLAIGFSGMLLYVLNTKDVKKKYLLAPFILLVAWAMQEIGTKVGIGGALIPLTIGTVIALIYALFTKKGWANVLILAVSTVLLFVYLPASPAGENINISYYKEVPVDPEVPIDEDDSVEKEPEYELDTENLPQRLLSGRDRYLADIQEDWAVAPTSQKILGMGPGGNYEESLKIIEIDYFDWYYSYGILGSILLFLPLLYFGIRVLYSFIKYRLKQITPTLLMVGVAVCLSLGIAAFAGHILLNPASGIYFAIFYAYLLVISAYPKDNLL
ncbi:O-antigen ligase family protein [Ornithinibacillus sp. 179-J 7C1 HS]|uniref:O-antigen ligase family protein n=1 Tax=Ornithinibacillus sp. 179-J 7C1 HS TaxID=3142384 RepID=UPI0039A1F3DC